MTLSRAKSRVTVWPASTRRLLHLHRTEAHEEGANRRRTGGNVVDEVVSAGIGQGTEGGADDHHLSFSDNAAGLVLDMAFDRAGGRLSAQQVGLSQEQALEHEDPSHERSRLRADGRTPEPRTRAKEWQPSPCPIRGRRSVAERLLNQLWVMAPRYGTGREMSTAPRSSAAREMLRIRSFSSRQRPERPSGSTPCPLDAVRPAPRACLRW